MACEEEMQHVLAELAAAREASRKTLATIESRIALMHDELKRTRETVSRLKLMLDNAKRLALRHGEALERLNERLDAIGGARG